MRLNKEEYQEAVGILKRYNYNCINILNIRADIMSISGPSIDGLPKAQYNISDTVFNQLVQLQENEALQKSLKEYKIVVQALELVNDDSKLIFEEIFRKSKTKYDMLEAGMSERTYFRRKKELILAVHKEIKKSWQ